MRWFALFAVVVLVLIGVAAWAQGPPPPCEDQLTNEMWQAGALKQQVAVARAQLAAMAKERDEAKAALAKVAPKAPDPPKSAK